MGDGAVPLVPEVKHVVLVPNVAHGSPYIDTAHGGAALSARHFEVGVGELGVAAVGTGLPYMEGFVSRDMSPQVLVAGAERKGPIGLATVPQRLPYLTGWRETVRCWYEEPFALSLNLFSASFCLLYGSWFQEK